MSDAAPEMVPILDSRRLPATLVLQARFATAAPQRLPRFIGSAVHGGLGRAVYRTVCAFPQREACPGCPLFTRCAYPLLFATPVPADPALHEAGVRDQAPRPLVLGPEPGWLRPPGQPVRLEAGAEIPLRLTLVGRAIDELPIVIVGLQRLARMGIGLHPEEPADGERRPPRPRLRLLEVTAAPGGHVVYDGTADRYHGLPRGGAGGAAVDEPEPAPSAATIEFVTPLRLKHNGVLASAVEPAVLVGTLARRANALAALFGPGAPVVDEARAAALASTLATAASDLRVVAVTRWSATQRQRMTWPGLVGRLVWAGEALGPLWPLLRFGEAVQVGKNTALGFGRFRLAAAGGVSHDRA